MPYGVYGAWVAIDFRLLWLVLFLSAGISLVLIGLKSGPRRWHEYVTLFVALFVINFIGILVLLKLFIGKSILITRDFFPLK